MKKSIILYLLLFLSISGHAQKNQIKDDLNLLPEVTYQQISNTADYNSNYVLKVKQPIDHNDPSKGFFNQKVYLSHKSFDQPTVLVTAGYQANNNGIYELTDLLKANQILVEHRFFGESMPDSLNYKYLNLEQATADLHHIKELFKDIYPKKWISTGISKGGATTIFYRYFYPNDVDVSVPYVAPINNTFEEPRIYEFLNTVGTDECRQKIKDFQIQVLKNRDKILPLLKFYSMGAGAKYSYLTIGEAFEYAVMEYPFSFWQWGASCDEIPSKKASIEDITKYFIEVCDLTFFSDQSIEKYNSHYYQAATEMGYYGYETSEFKDLLVDLPTDKNPMALFFTFKMEEPFNGEILEKTNKWLKKKGNHIIYIYGGNDTWTASAVPFSSKVDSKWFILKDKHHGNARIKGMNTSEKEAFISTLEKWLSIKIEH